MPCETRSSMIMAIAPSSAFRPKSVLWAQSPTDKQSGARPEAPNPKVYDRFVTFLLTSHFFCWTPVRKISQYRFLQIITNAYPSSTNAKCAFPVPGVSQTPSRQATK